MMASERKESSGALATRAVDHVSYTVPDLRQAVAFFVNVLGAQVRYERRSGELDAATAGRFHVAQGSSFQIAKLDLAGTPLELFEYSLRGGSTVMAGNAVCGGGHIGLLVDDFDAAVERLRAVPDVRLLGESSVLPGDHLLAGRRWIYFLTPWGLQLELVSAVPQG